MRAIESYGLAWKTSDGNIYRADNGKAYLKYSDKTLTELPVEFFSHQLMDLDTESDDAIANFCKRYGIPLHPYRYTEYWYADADIKPAIEATNRLGMGAVSCEEIRLAVYALQESLKTMFAYIREEANTYNLNPIVAASCNPVASLQYPDTPISFSPNEAGGDSSSHVFWNSRLDGCSLTNAICNQVIDTIADDRHEWRECACEGCNRVFKVKQSNRPVASGKHPSNSVYCSTTCENRQGQRNKRKAAKNRIDHGI